MKITIETDGDSATVTVEETSDGDQVSELQAGETATEFASGETSGRRDAVDAGGPPEQLLEHTGGGKADGHGAEDSAWPPTEDGTAEGPLPAGEFEALDQDER